MLSVCMVIYWYAICLYGITYMYGDICYLLQLFKGKFYYCDGGDVSDVLNKTDCIRKGDPFRWVNQKYNFDDLGQVFYMKML